ncbi:MAG: DMT family transporter [Paracoccaceae bacterium]
MTPTKRDWAFLAALGVIWGASFMATKVATGDFGPFAIAGGRLALGALAMNVVLVAMGQRLPGVATGADRRFWLYALGAAAFSNAVPFCLLSWAQARIDSALAGVLMATVPFFVLPLGHAFVPGERLGWRKLAGFAIGLMGVVVLIGPEVVADLGTGGAVALLAQAACLGVAFCYACGSVVSKLAPERGLLPFGTAALTLAALMTVPFALALDAPFAGAVSGEALLAVAYLGLVPTALATLMLLVVVKSAGPSFLSLVNYQVPLWAVVFGVTVLGERPSPRLAIAFVLIAAGLAVTQGYLGIRRGGHARG